MANHHITPFFLEKKDVVLIKPSKPTSPCVLSLSTIDNDHNLELITQTIYVYQASVNSTNGSDPACVIEEALSKVLVYYYPLAGKLKRNSDGKLRINSNEDGVPFLEATANCELSSLRSLDGIDVETAEQFVFDWPCDGDGGYHPLVLQLTKFSCGGFTIGMGLSHSVCDGFGAALFFRAIAELASGKSEPSVKPVWERERQVVKPSQDPIQFVVVKASLAASPYLPTNELFRECFNVSCESIRKLKMVLMKESENEVLNENLSFTTLEVLGAYVWRSRAMALKLNPDGKTHFCLALARGDKKLIETTFACWVLWLDSSMRDGVRICVSLPRAAMAKIEKWMLLRLEMKMIPRI
ncbi:hypothetical protein F0562_001163 [Nyssa sinensis]|uniref:Uncharacterized protein n=1 Tax=Nyssa sinensis TaxID=561372 RepID=A0A5J5C2T1_9ASTE|nr:hypothetical protein F0562_001163 [Nyssa sinensis]